MCQAFTTYVAYDFPLVFVTLPKHTTTTSLYSRRVLHVIALAKQKTVIAHRKRRLLFLFSVSLQIRPICKSYLSIQRLHITIQIRMYQYFSYRPTRTYLWNPRVQYTWSSFIIRLHYFRASIIIMFPAAVGVLSLSPF